MNKVYGADNPNIVALMDLVQAIPGSSSECERGFTQMKAIKTDISLSLGEESLSKLLTITIHSPQVLRSYICCAMGYFHMISTASIVIVNISLVNMA